MRRRLAGTVLVVVGLSMVVVGLAGWARLFAGDAVLAEAGLEPTTDLVATTTAVADSSTAVGTAAPSTSAATSSTIAATSPSTSQAAPKIAEPNGVALIHAFVGRFVDALESDDVAFIFDSLHPQIVESYGRDLCQEWIEREIVALDDYQLVGEPKGPRSRTTDTPSGPMEIAATYEAPASFTIRGQPFEATAGFAILDGSVYWLGVCR